MDSYGSILYFLHIILPQKYQTRSLRRQSDYTVQFSALLSNFRTHVKSLQIKGKDYMAVVMLRNELQLTLRTTYCTVNRSTDDRGLVINLIATNIR